MRPIVFACAVIVLGVAVPAVAEDPPAKPAAGPIQRRAKIEQPLLVGMLGLWQATPADPEDKTRLVWMHWMRALDGTAWVEAAGAGEASTTFSVLYVDAAGTGVTVWRFFHENPGEAMVQHGTLSETALDLAAEGNLPGMKIEKSDADLVVTRGFGGVQGGATTYRKTNAMAGSVPEPKPPFLGGLTGTFETAGTFKMGTQEFTQKGTASVGGVARGVFSLTNYEAQAGAERKLGLGIAGLEADAKTFHYWWFTDHFDAPTLVSGEATDKEWKGKGESVMGPFEMSWTRTEAGFDLKMTFAAGTMTETFTRKK